MKFKLPACFLAAVLAAGAANATEIVFLDPSGDDDGPGSYVYPTDPVFKRGSFDLQRFAVDSEGAKIDFAVKVNSTLEDPWRMGVGYSVQMIFIFVDTDNAPGSGHTDGLPGLNVAFDSSHAWDKVIILSPQDAKRVSAEVTQKAPDMAADVIVTRSKGSGQVIHASVDAGLLGGGDPVGWSYQVVMQSNEGFPSGRDLLTRRVNEFAGPQRFGGGDDGHCEPGVTDVLAGEARGESDEIDAQHAMLAYECSLDGETLTLPKLTMVRAPG